MQHTVVLLPDKQPDQLLLYHSLRPKQPARHIHPMSIQQNISVGLHSMPDVRITNYKFSDLNLQSVTLLVGLNEQPVSSTPTTPKGSLLAYWQKVWKLCWFNKNQKTVLRLTLAVSTYLIQCIAGNDISGRHSLTLCSPI